MDLSSIGRRLDQGLAVFAPRLAASRARARAALDGMERAAELVRRFEGASTGRNAANWFATNGSMDSELRSSLSRLRARSRDLTSNNCWASSAVDALQSDLIGTGILWKPRTRARKANVQLEDKARRLFEPWFESTACDLRARQTGYAMQSTAAREMVEAGEVLVRRVWTTDSEVPFRLQFLEADHIDTARDGLMQPDGGIIVQGVEYDPSGKVRAYYLFRNHPGDWASALNLNSERVPASDVIHLFETLRFGQSRGLTRAAPCLIRLRNFDEYEGAEEIRKKVLACFVGFVHDLALDASPHAGLGEPTDEDGDPANGVAPVRKFSPGTWQSLPPGKGITFGEPKGDDNYVPYSQISLRGVAAAYGVTYERLTGDLKGVNFSSGRMGNIRYHALLDRLTWLTIVPVLCDRIFDWFVEAMAIKGELPRGERAASWTAPRRPMVDPSVELPAEQAAVRAGFKTRRSVIRSMGEDPAEVEREFVEENAAADSLGLSFDSDGRRPVQQSGDSEPSDDPPETEGADTAD